MLVVWVRRIPGGRACVSASSLRGGMAGIHALCTYPGP